MLVAAAMAAAVDRVNGPLCPCARAVSALGRLIRWASACMVCAIVVLMGAAAAGHAVNVGGLALAGNALGLGEPMAEPVSPVGLAAARAIVPPRVQRPRKRTGSGFPGLKRPGISAGKPPRDTDEDEPDVDTSLARDTDHSFP